jgi:hypothetical protein
LSLEYGDRSVDNVAVEAEWQALKSRARSQLIDVRTRAEWSYVGIPDLGSLSKRAVASSIRGIIGVCCLSIGPPPGLSFLDD